MNDSAASLWTRMMGKKSGVIRNAERYSELTIRKLLLKEGTVEGGESITHDYQSLGAQAVNHLTNKLMVVMFRPSAPFFRIQVGKKTKQQLQPEQLIAIGKQLAEIERDAVRELDSKAQRPKLYAIMRHLIVLGNVLMIREKDSLRVMSLRYYCVKRTLDGRIHTLVTNECIAFNELAADVQEAVKSSNVHKHDEDKVNYYQVVRLQPNGSYITEQWVNELHLDQAKFGGRYTKETLPFHALTWDLADEHDYGTGLVEEYHGDFEALSALAEASVDGSVQATVLWWLIDPTAQLRPEDVNRARNGDALPGRKEDMSPVTGGNIQGLDVVLKNMQHWEQRIARAFLLMSAVTRDAERVTAEEIRALVQELESALGGNYSGLSNQIQGPIARWLLDIQDMSIDGADVTIQVITGLDALSRNADLEAMRLALNDLALLMQVPPELLRRLKIGELASFVGDGRGIDLSPFLKDEATVQEEDAQMRAKMAAQEAITAGGVAAAQQGMTKQ